MSNKLNFRSVHGIMSTFVLRVSCKVNVKSEERRFLNLARDLTCS